MLSSMLLLLRGPWTGPVSLVLQPLDYLLVKC